MQRIQIPDGSPPPALVDAAVRAVKAGKMVVLPTETVYGLAVDPTREPTVARLSALKVRPPEQRFTHHLHGIEQVPDLAQEPPARVQAFLARFWPGPLTVILAARPEDGGDDVEETVGLRVPAHDFTRAVIRKLGHSLFMTSVNRGGEEPLADPDAIAEGFHEVDILFDAGPPRLGTPSTVVRFAHGRTEVLREGLLTRDDVLVGIAAKILFVCTGNTCRSPMATALARQVLAEKLGVEEDELLPHGLFFASVGAGTLPGMSDSAGAIEAMAELDLDLRSHRSASLAAESVNVADRVYCLSGSQRHAVVGLVPEAADKTALLRPDGKDIADPFGAVIAVYRDTAKEIEAALRKRAQEIVDLL